MSYWVSFVSYINSNRKKFLLSSTNKRLSLNKHIPQINFLIHLFLIKGQLFYNIVLVSSIHQHESAIGIHRSPPSWTSLPPPTPFNPSRLSQSHGLSSLSHTANSHQLSILHMVVYMFPCYYTPSSQLISPY